MFTPLDRCSVRCACMIRYVHNSRRQTKSVYIIWFYKYNALLSTKGKNMMFPVILALLTSAIYIRVVSSQQPTNLSTVTKERMAEYLKNNSLVDVLKAASGYYTDASKAKQRGLQNTVLVTGGNFGYLNHIHNFNCFARRLELKYLVISMELHTHYYLQKRGFYSYYLDTSSSSNTTETIEEQSSAFREQQFNFITNKKKKAVQDILRLGYSVIFSDTDGIV